VWDATFSLFVPIPPQELMMMLLMVMLLMMIVHAFVRIVCVQCG
jgi:hypothetical protein